MSSLKVSRILHAGYVFECEETKIAFDPIFENPFSRNCHAFPSVRFDTEQIKTEKFDAVFISHYHDDHCSLDSLHLLDRRTPVYIYCVFEEMFDMIQRLGFQSVHRLQIDEPVRMGAMEIIPRRALDADVDSIFQIKAAGLNVLNVVDSWIDPETLSLLQNQKPWDLVLWPFQTMREIEVIAPRQAMKASGFLPQEWIEQLQVLSPRILVPSSCQFQMESWSWYNRAFFPISYRQFQEQVQTILSETEILRINPGVSFRLTADSLEMSQALSWIVPIEKQDVDYVYDPDIKPPPTAEIAKRFVPLTNEQTERVLEYCGRGLLEKYKVMDPPLDEYFDQPRLWRLSVYDHQGDATHFHYRVEGSKIEPASVGDLPLAWTTEVSIAKLYAALELGEALTSMYLRINDTDFAPQIEKQIQDVDIVEDPLIRCLFNGVFGAYQAAQLRYLCLNLR